jgi:putative hydrolase of the HAD superfamily
MSAEPQAIFFDMDGTILDWQSGMEESWYASCDEHCDGTYEPTKLHEAIRTRRTWFWDDAERAYTGRMDLDAASRQIVRHAFDDMRLSNIELAHQIADAYRAMRAEAMAPYPGAIELLQSLRDRGVPMALITNGGAISQRRSVERFGLEKFFDCVVIEGEFGVGKPDEKVFRHALATCSVEPDRTWMVGDSYEADIVTPVALGMHAVWIDGAGAGLPGGHTTKPHRTIARIDQLFAG